MSEPISHGMPPIDQYNDEFVRKSSQQSNSQVSRQREQDGARASCCEISPERPESFKEENKIAFQPNSSSSNYNTVEE